MRTLTASSLLLLGLAWHCMPCASTQDLSLKNRLIDLECEMLPVENCAFSIGAGGFRCVLETAAHVDGSVSYQCQTLRLELQPGSNAGRLGLQFGSRENPFFGVGYIETNECITTCGLQRLTVGISTDDILYDNDVLEKLCSPNCRQKCANIIEHYGLVLADSGEDLTRVCQDVLEYLRAEKKRAEKKREKKPISRKSLHTHGQSLNEKAPAPNTKL